MPFYEQIAKLEMQLQIERQAAAQAAEKAAKRAAERAAAKATAKVAERAAERAAAKVAEPAAAQRVPVPVSTPFGARRVPVDAAGASARAQSLARCQSHLASEGAWAVDVPLPPVLGPTSTPYSAPRPSLPFRRPRNE